MRYHDPTSDPTNHKVGTDNYGNTAETHTLIDALTPVLKNMASAGWLVWATMVWSHDGLDGGPENLIGR